MTAVTMMINYAGKSVSKFTVANETPRSSNGNYGFVGSPYKKTGWWVYPVELHQQLERIQVRQRL